MSKFTGLLGARERLIVLFLLSVFWSGLLLSTEEDKAGMTETKVHLFGGMDNSSGRGYRVRDEARDDSCTVTALSCFAGGDDHKSHWILETADRRRKMDDVDLVADC